MNSYQKVYNKMYTGEHAQNLVRAHLHDSAQDHFPCGEKGTVLVEVIHEMLKSNNGMEIWTTCLECNIPKQTISHEEICTFEHIDRQVQNTTELIHSEMRVKHSPQYCTMSSGQMDPHTTFVQAPKIISVILDARCKIIVDKTIKIMNQNGRSTILYLRGLVYYGDFHFVCRVITTGERIWYNDGKSMGHTSTVDGTL